MHRSIIVDKNAVQKDIIPLHAGYEICAPSHRFGPYQRKEYLIHYCLSGCGTLTDRYGVHRIGAGELFIIRPGEITVYEADALHPWHYVWIGFAGELAKGFSTDRSVYACPAEPFHRLCALVDEGDCSTDVYTAAIYELRYHLFSREHEKRNTLSKIQRYIRYHYMNDITVEAIGQMFGYERTHLYRLFQARYGLGVKAYIIQVRMENARRFLREGYSVSQTAQLSGYGDAFAFSKAYKKYYGCAPSAIFLEKGKEKES